MKLYDEQGNEVPSAHYGGQWAQTEAVKVKLRNAVHAARRWRMLANAYRNNAASPLVVACLPDGLRCPTCGGKLVGL